MLRNKNCFGELHVFDESHTLPPTRSHDQIPLKDSSKPIQIRPYGCPCMQKTEVEKFVKEILHIGIIQPSNSSYITCIFFVKREDGS